MSNVREFGAAGDGRTDDTAAIQHAIDDGDGLVELPRGDYRITRSLTVELAARGRTAISGSGGVAKLIIDGAGPAIDLRATHSSTADPAGFRPEEWQRERMPTVRDIEIEGRHAEADGVRIRGVMQATLTGVLIRRVRTALHVTDRARNLIVDHCHFYHNTGVGIHLDRVNMHQAIVSASHVSYCRLGGIRIEASEVRNLQITGNDIEYNNNRAHGIPDADAVPTAEIFVDVREGTVREGTISGNTLQATYSENGANIRFIGRGGDASHKAGMWTITGNLIGSQQVNVHLTSVRGVTISGNYLYSGHHRNLLVEGSRTIVLGPNCFGHNPDYGARELATGIRFEDCESCTVTGILIEDAGAGRHTVDGAPPLARDGLVELVRCRGVTVSGCQILDGTPYGLWVEDASDTVITGCTVLDRRATPAMRAAIRWRGAGKGNLVASSRLGRGTERTLDVEGEVRCEHNLLDAGAEG